MARGIGIVITIIVIAVIIGGYFLITSMQTPIDTGTGDNSVTNGDTGTGDNSVTNGDTGTGDGSSGGSSEGTGGTTQPTTYNVEIKDYAFNPSELRIKKGDTVKWTNLDGAQHTVSSDVGDELYSHSLRMGEIYSHTFNTAGTFKYHCSSHAYMKGEIIVE